MGIWITFPYALSFGTEQSSAYARTAGNESVVSSKITS